MTEKATSPQSIAATFFAHPLGGGAMTSWMEAVTECQRDLVDFVTERVAKDNDVISQLMASKSPAEAFEAQTRWARETMADYSTEASRILAICTKHQAKVQ